MVILSYAIQDQTLPILKLSFCLSDLLLKLLFELVNQVDGTMMTL